MTSKLKQVVWPIQIAESTNQNRTKTAAGISARVMKAGATYTSTDFSGDAAATIAATFRVADKGAIEVGDNVDVWDKTNNTNRSYSLTVATIDYEPSSDYYNITFSAAAGAATFDIDDGDRFIFPLSDANELTLYADSSADNGLSNPVVLGTDGMLEFYSNAELFDLYLSGDGVTDNWYTFDVPIGRALANRIDLSYEIVTTATTISINRDTTLVFTSGSGTIEKIEDSDENRFVILYPQSSGTNLSLVQPASADNQILGSSTSTLALTPNRPVFLVARELGGFSVWSVMDGAGTPALDDLSDVDESSPATSDVLQYDGSNWIGAKTLGSSSTPLTALHVLANQLRLVNGSGFDGAFNGSALTADRGYVLPNADGTLVITGPDQYIDGQKTFDDASTGLRIKSQTGTDRVAVFDVSGVSDSTVVTITVPNSDITLADNADLIPYTAGSPSDGYPLAWDATNSDYRPTNTLGDDTGGVTVKGALDLQSNALASAYALLQFGGLTSQNVTVPTSPSGSAQTLLANKRSASFTLEGPSASPASNGVFAHDDAFYFVDPADTTKRVRIDAGSVATGTTRIITMPDEDVDLSKADQGHALTESFEFAGTANANAISLTTLLGRNNAIFLSKPSVNIEITRVLCHFVVAATAGTPSGTLNLYYGNTFPNTTSVPVGSGTAVLSSAINLASITGTHGELLDTSSFANANVAAGNYLWMSAASTLTGPSSESRVTITVEYKVVV